MKKRDGSLVVGAKGQNWLLPALVVVLFTALASNAFANKVVVGQPEVISGRPGVVLNAPVNFLAGWQAREDTVIPVAPLKDVAEARAAGQAHEADMVVFGANIRTESKQVLLLLPPRRFHKGKCWTEFRVLDMKTGWVSRHITDAERPYAVQYGDKCSPWVTGSGLVVGGAMASNLLFPHWSTAQPLGYVLGGVGYLAGSQATPAEAAAAITGGLLVAKDILPAVGDFVSYGIGGTLMLVPLFKAKGNPAELEAMAYRKAIEKMVVQGKFVVPGKL